MDQEYQWVAEAVMAHVSCLSYLCQRATWISRPSLQQPWQQLLPPPTSHRRMAPRLEFSRPTSPSSSRRPDLPDSRSPLLLLPLTSNITSIPTIRMLIMTILFDLERFGWIDTTWTVSLERDLLDKQVHLFPPTLDFCAWWPLCANTYRISLSWVIGT